jgi:hypothetical protein
MSFSDAKHPYQMRSATVTVAVGNQVFQTPRLWPPEIGLWNKSDQSTSGAVVGPLEVNPTRGFVPLTVTITGPEDFVLVAAKDTGKATIGWGDGTSAVAPFRITHTYTRPGTYHVYTTFLRSNCDQLQLKIEFERMEAQPK